jgi:hypothetical protein
VKDSFLSCALGPLLLLETLLIGCSSSPTVCEAVLCDDQNVCTEDQCDPGNGTCVYAPVVDGAECDFAGLPGVCRSGLCTDADLCGGVDCDDQNDCTEERCVATTGLCEHTDLPDGTSCSGGGCEGGVCTAEFSCTKEGILSAIAAGGGPYTFACDGPTTVAGGQMVIDNDVALDGEGNLTVRGHFTVNAEVVVELRRLTVREGQGGGLGGGGGIYNFGTLSLSNCTVTQNRGEVGAGIYNDKGNLTLTNSTVSWNLNAVLGGGIFNDQGTVMLINSTLSQNDAATGSGLANSRGTVTMTSCTIAQRFGSSLDSYEGEVTMTATLLQGACSSAFVTSGDFNIESPGNTCGLDGTNDQVGTPEMQLWLGALKDNGGDTYTHVPGPGSVAIDVIPAEQCVTLDSVLLAADQRGVERPQGLLCDVGSVEVESDP